MTVQEANGKEARIQNLEQQTKLLFEKNDKIIEDGCPMGRFHEQEIASIKSDVGELKKAVYKAAGAVGFVLAIVTILVKFI